MASVPCPCEQAKIHKEYDPKGSIYLERTGVLFTGTLGRSANAPWRIAEQLNLLQEPLQEDDNRSEVVTEASFCYDSGGDDDVDTRSVASDESVDSIESTFTSIGRSSARLATALESLKEDLAPPTQLEEELGPEKWALSVLTRNSMIGPVDPSTDEILTDYDSRFLNFRPKYHRREFRSVYTQRVNDSRTSGTLHHFDPRLALALASLYAKAVGDRGYFPRGHPLLVVSLSKTQHEENVKREEPMLFTHPLGLKCLLRHVKHLSAISHVRMRDRADHG